MYIHQIAWGRNSVLYRDVSFFLGESFFRGFTVLVRGRTKSPS